MKHKRIAIVVSVIVVAILAVILGWRMWGHYEITATVESAQPLVCTTSVRESHCGDGVIKVRTDDGIEKEYRYLPSVFIVTEQGRSAVFTLEKGAKVKLTISRGNGKIVQIRMAE